MNRVLLLFLLSASCLLLTFFLLPTLSYAQSAADIQAQIDANNRQLQAIQADIVAYQKQLDVLGSQKNTLQGTISSLTISQKQLTSQIQATQNKIASANLKIRDLTNSIGDKETTIAENQDAIAKSLRGIAEGEHPSLVIQIVSSHSLSDVWRTADQAIQFNEALTDNVESLRTVRRVLATNRDQVSKVKADLVALQDDLALQKKSVEVSKATQQKLFDDTKNQESVYQKLLADKRAEESRFETMLFELASQLEYVLDPSRIPPAGKGILRWPLSSVFITQQFGKSSSAQRLYTSGTHDGIDFRASVGTPIRAALSGTVLDVNLGAVPNCQYGKWILIKHANGLATLYAHLSSISVQKNNMVITGQAIGFSGNTGYATGPHLHLSVYYADAISFRQYTCKNGQKVTIPIAPLNAYLNPLSYF